MKRRLPSQRPEEFQLDRAHALASGLVFAGLGRVYGSNLYHDSSLYGNHGTLTAMDPATDWVWDSKLGRWVTYYDGAAHYTTVGANNVAFNVGTNPFLLAMWWYYDGADQPHATSYYISKSDGASNYRYCLRTGNIDGRIQGAIYDGAATYSTATCNFKVDISASPAWYHVAIGRIGGSIQLYINGAAWGAAGTGAELNLTSTANFFIGARDAAARYVRGKCADVYLAQCADHATRVQQLADPSNVMLSGLILPPRRRLWAISGGAPAVTRPAHIIGGGIAA